MKKILITISCFILSITAFCQPPEEQAALELAKQGKYPEAIAAFEKIITADGKNVNAINVLSQLYLRSNKAQQGYDVATRGLGIAPDNIDLNITKAKAAMALSRDDEALTIMDAAITKHDDVFILYVIKGNVLDDQNKIQLAIGAYSKSIQLKPDFPFAYLSRAEDFASISRYENALTDYNKFIEMIPDNDEGYNMRGSTNHKLGKNTEALADYSKAIELNKDQKYALVNRGILYAETGAADKAMADYNHAKTIDANFDDAYYELAKLYQKQRNYPPAQQNIEKAIGINNRVASYYTVYAKILLGADKNAEGLAAAEKVIAMDKVNADGYLLKATAYSNMERYDDAIAAINDGLKLFPDNYMYYSLRSAVYKFKGNIAMSDADNQKAKELGTKN
ncbi:tetratricopeptide repeat protein [Mucilaginibacter sp.]|uniref:tetratricopeptide repeat protein n=1 Tax=Mucilaginibacter sp. TaxID=1882438 RepID=UPI0025DB138E|nr:tetratricopeptide repeat protein [Mucilaginibacter sp.]